MHLSEFCRILVVHKNWLRIKVVIHAVDRIFAETHVNALFRHGHYAKTLQNMTFFLCCRVGKLKQKTLNNFYILVDY